MRLRPGGSCVCVTAQMFGHSITPWGSSAAPGCSPGWQPCGRAPLGTQPPQGGTYHLPLCATSPFCQPASAVLLYSWEKRGRALHTRHTPTRPQQLCRAAMGNCSKGGVKSYSNSLCCHSSSFPPTSSSICHRRPCSKRNRQRQDVSCKIK